MRTLPKTDVVVIGGGWTGLLIAKELAARTPLKVVILERGPAQHTRDYAGGMDELDYNVRFRLMQDYSLETATLRHTVRDRAIPMRQLGSFMPGQGTGGSGEHWTAVFPRYLPDIFELLKNTKEKYGLKKLPEDHAIVDWGITWNEIEPYYTRADKLVGASGKAGNIRGKLIDGGNTYEGPRSERGIPHTSDEAALLSSPWRLSSKVLQNRLVTTLTPIPLRPSARSTPIPMASCGPAAYIADSATASAA